MQVLLSWKPCLHQLFRSAESLEQRGRESRICLPCSSAMCPTLCSPKELPSLVKAYSKSTVILKIGAQQGAYATSATSGSFIHPTNTY